MNAEQQRHRVLAGISRSRLLAVLQGAARPMAIRELADAVALHPNTAREHLDQLVGAGLARRETAPPAGRGRPGLRYQAEPQDPRDGSEAYRALATVLVAELAERADARTAATAAGERWGRAAAQTMPAAPDANRAVDRLVDLLDDVGFAPEPGANADEIWLQRCPFGSLARDVGTVVCNVHLGLMRGALRQLDAPLDTVSLEPFVEPDRCLVHLGARTNEA
ncbi:MAG: helix-turn-helix domain-containing protein [Chloroflexota bacterium]